MPAGVQRLANRPPRTTGGAMPTGVRRFTDRRPCSTAPVRVVAA